MKSTWHIKQLRVIFSCLSLVLLGGCIPSLHGIVTDETEMTDDRILGTWSLTEDPSSLFQWEDKATGVTKMTTAESRWTFRKPEKIRYERGDDHSTLHLGGEIDSIDFADVDFQCKTLYPSYILTHEEIVASRRITTHLVTCLSRIGSYTYIDFQPVSQQGCDVEGRFTFNRVYAHTFARIRLEKDRIVLSPFNGDYLEDLLEGKRIRLKHEVMDDSMMVLTASSDELVAFIEKYENDPKLFEGEEELMPF